MDDAVAAVLAAVISAAAVAGTFALAEVIKVVQAGRRERTEAVLEVLTALEQMPLYAVRALLTPWPFRKLLSPPDLTIAAAAIRLFARLPRRDRIVAEWAGWRLAGLEEADIHQRVTISSEINGVLIGYLANRRRARKSLSRHRPEIEAWIREA